MNATGVPSLAHLSDAKLLDSLANITRRHRALTAELVLHLLEVDRRKLYLEKAKSSLFRYCVDCLGFSEDEAYRRIEAARLVGKFPPVFGWIQRGDVSLTVLGKLKPFLDFENVEELLAAVANRSVHDAERVLAARYPKPDVADSIRALPRRAQPVASPSTSPIAASRADEKPPSGDPPTQPVGSNGLPSGDRPAESRCEQEPDLAAALPPAADRGRLSPLSAERILIKFTASRAFEEKLARARDLMSHSNPKGDLATVLEAALDLLIAEKSKSKFGVTKRPAKKQRRASKQRITNQARREVVERDGMRCSFVSTDGNRCDSTAFLELDHAREKSRGGSSDTKNVRVFCRAHNQHAAEKTFGRAFMAQKRKEKPLSVKDGARAHSSYESGGVGIHPRQRDATDPRVKLRFAQIRRVLHPRQRDRKRQGPIFREEVMSHEHVGFSTRVNATPSELRVDVRFVRAGRVLHPRQRVTWIEMAGWKKVARADSEDWGLGLPSDSNLPRSRSRRANFPEIGSLGGGAPVPTTPLPARPRTCRRYPGLASADRVFGSQSASPIKLGEVSSAELAGLASAV